MNQALERQIQEFLGGMDHVPAHLTALFQRISESYDYYEKDKKIIERSVDLSAKEMIELNERLLEEKEELSQVHTELQTLFANIGEVFFSIDVENSQLLQISPACQKVYGYCEDDFFRNTDLWLDVVADEDRINVKKNYPHILSGESWIGEYRIVRKDRSICWVETKLKPTLDVQGRLVRLDGITADISARKEAEEKLRQNEERLRMILDSEPECVKMVDVSGALLEMNPAGLKMIDAWSEEEVKGKKVIGLIHPDDREIFMDLHNRVCKGERGTASFRVISLKQREIWMETHSVPLRNAKGEIYAVLSVTRDVTVMRKSQQLIADNEKRYRALVENSGDGVAIISPAGNPTYVSTAVKRMLGYTEEEAAGLDMFNAVHPDDLRMVEEAWGKVIASRGVPFYVGICRVRHKDGSWRWMESTMTNMTHDPAVGGIVDNFREVTERVIADRALRESEEKRRLIMNAAMDAIICSDMSGVITFWNQQAENIFGWKAEEVIGLPLTDTIIPPAFRDMHRKGVKRYRDIGQGQRMNQLLELSAINKNGKEFPVELRVVAISQDGEEFFCAFMRDITERKKAEGKLQRRTTQLIATKNELESNEKSLKEAQAMAHLGSWEYDFTTNKAKWSDESYRILGLKKGDVIPSLESFLSFIHPEDIKFVRETIAEGEKSLAGCTFDSRIIRKDGALRYIHSDWKFILDKQGKPTGIRGILYDITNIEEANEKLRQNQARLKQAQAIAHMGSWEINFSGGIFKWSDEAYRIYGMEPGEQDLTPDSWLTFIHPEDLGYVRSVIKEAHSSFTDFSFHHRIVRKDGVVRYLLSESKFEFDHTGTATGLYGIVHDVTEQKQNEDILKGLNDQIQKRAEELAASNAELERFAYVASHDLQEPLRMVSSFVQLLQKKYNAGLDDTARQYIAYAVDGADRMKRLILDLLAYSRVGTNNDGFSNTDLSTVVDQVLLTFDAEVKEKAARIQVGQMPVVRANKTQMTQLFQNLVSNAFKYNTTAVPEIKIGCEEKGDAWQFYVKDNGIGIEEKYYEKVFAIFQRLHNKSQFSGTGIGLAICKKIIERHEGNIWIESVPGQGSTFLFTLKK